MCFVVYNRPQLRKDHPEVNPKDLLKIAGQKWNTLLAEEKVLWDKEASHANTHRTNLNDNMKTFWENRANQESCPPTKRPRGTKNLDQYQVERQFYQA